jgi:rod shape-determining protein MreD
MAYVGILLVILLDNAVRVVVPETFPVAHPDLALVTALDIGFRARNTKELGLAVVLGLVADCFSARPIGHFAFLYGLGAYMALRMRRYVPSDAFWSHVIACLVCGLCTGGAAFAIAVLTVPGHVGPGLVRSLAQAGAGAAVAPVLFSIWDRSGFFRRALGGDRYEFVR